MLLPCYDIQHSAADVIQDVRNGQPDDQFWVSLESDDLPTVHGNVLVTAGGVLDDSHSAIKVTRSASSLMLDNRVAVEFPKAQKRVCTAPVTCADVHPNGRLLVLGHSDGQLSIAQQPTGSGVGAPNSGASGAISEANPELDGTTINIDSGHVFTSCVRLVAGGECAVSAGSDMQIKIWSMANSPGLAVNHNALQTLRGHRAPVTDILPLARGRSILTSSIDASVKLWEVGSASCVANFDVGSPVHGLAMVHDTTDYMTWDGQVSEDAPLEFGTKGRVFAAVSDRGLEVYDVRNRQKVHQHDSSGLLKVAAWDSKVATGSSAGEVSITDLRHPSRPVYTFSRSHHPVSSLNLHKESLTFASVYDSTAVHLQLGGDAVTYLSGSGDQIGTVLETCRGLIAVSKKGVVSVYR